MDTLQFPNYTYFPVSLNNFINACQPVTQYFRAHTYTKQQNLVSISSRGSFSGYSFKGFIQESHSSLFVGKKGNIYPSSDSIIVFQLPLSKGKKPLFFHFFLKIFMIFQMWCHKAWVKYIKLNGSQIISDFLHIIN